MVSLQSHIWTREEARKMRIWPRLAGCAFGGVHVSNYAFVFVSLKILPASPLLLNNGGKRMLKACLGSEIQLKTYRTDDGWVEQLVL